MRFLALTALLVGVTTASAADLVVSVLDRNGKPLEGAVVQVDTSAQGPRPAPAQEATISQEKLRFSPSVTVVGIGAKVTFVNLDSWDHHVIYGLVAAGDTYLDPKQNVQLRLAAKTRGKAASSEGKVLVQPGPYLLACHLHGSMRGHVFVSEAPWAKVTESSGRVVMQGLPAGAARVRVWHPDQLVETAPLTVQVAGEGGESVVRTQITASRSKQASQPDPYAY